MSDKILRTKLIRLAHANPHLRVDLLPLLAKQAVNTAAKQYIVSVLDDGGQWFYIGSPNGSLIPSGGYNHGLAHRFLSKEDAEKSATRAHPRMRHSVELYQ